MNFTTFSSEVANIIDENYHLEDFGVPKVAELLNISERTLHRACAKYLHKTPNQLILEFKINRAKDHLLNGFSTERAFKESGFNTFGAFRKAFIKETGTSPSKFAHKDNSIRNLKEGNLKKEIENAINDNYLFSDFSVERLAELLGVTQRTLHRRCVELLNISPVAYINKMRIDKAITLLKKGAPVTNLDDTVGFNTEPAFRAAFKKETGTTPIRYLEELQARELAERVSQIQEYLAVDICNSTEVEIKRALRDSLNINLPQRRTLIEAICASASDHKILPLILEYYEIRADSNS